MQANGSTDDSLTSTLCLPALEACMCMSMQSAPARQQARMQARIDFGDRTTTLDMSSALGNSMTLMLPAEKRNSFKRLWFRPKQLQISAEITCTPSRLYDSAHGQAVYAGEGCGQTFIWLLGNPNTPTP